MRAARLVEPGTPLEIQDVPVPEVESDQVLVKVAGAGVCHSDLHILDMAGGITLPRTLGHENTGYVERFGSDVTGIREGDAVAVYGGWGCGRCRYCEGGEEQRAIRDALAARDRHAAVEGAAGFDRESFGQGAPGHEIFGAPIEQNGRR